ncbi:Enoyl-CoA hydratase/carnithine racemase [Salinibacillus kushneri]|uniref:Enoyl-CoA hydratase/carnithine racemase n=1 Tax=Salinibacillus kushneri TaxID=237682 RepID=A0A1I0DZ07_9BACI|nr:enoyl-CoA hydratase [Salinibacillus kushneri]SET37826.1 Enoyl-CoA hydratase/carnithine racemase [Salinibacillus kushneri]
MQTVLFDVVEDYIGLLTLNRPQAANAFSVELLKDLNDCLNQIEKHDHIRVLIIKGSGEKAFCAGADLKEREKMSDDKVVETVKRIKETIHRIESLPIPVIASINGAAFGGGLELALACDIRIASTQALLGLTETSLGIIPGAGGTQRLARLIGPGKAKYLIFTARRLTAEEAYKYGIIERIADRNKLVETVLAEASIIAENGPIGVQQAKEAIQSGLNTDLKSGLEIEEQCYKKTIPTQDRIEGIKAFKEKRKPHYKGK